MYIFIARLNYSRSFHISELNDLKIVYDLYSQCLTQTLFIRPV
jgi:hypothetical protein